MEQRIKMIRKNQNLTQTEFGERIGVKGNTVTGYETGLRKPSDAIIVSICREFDVNETWLRTGEGDIFVPMSRIQEIANFVGQILKGEEDTFKRRFVAMLSRLDERDWDVLEKMVNEMKKD